MSEFVGSRLPRTDAKAKVRGQALFIDDISFSGQLYAAVVRSPVARGVIEGLDSSALDELSQVKGVFTAVDIPGCNIVPVVLRDQPCLAEKEVRYCGEPVAVVAATTRDMARFAAQKVVVRCKPMEAVLDAELGMAKDAPKIYGQDNIFSKYHNQYGDVDSAFGEAAAVVQAEFHTPYQEHAYLEPQGMVAVPGATGIEIYGSMQCPFYVREGVAEVLGMKLSRVKVIQTTTGGAFGGKEDVPSLVASQAALAAWHTGRPVKLIYTREEDMVSMSKRHPGHIRYRLAADGQGKLLAAQVTYILDAGAYSTLSPVVLWRGTIHAFGSYQVPNVWLKSYAVATNKVPCGAFRGFGSPQILFAVESAMDMLAAKLGMDPAEIRRLNILKSGDFTGSGQQLESSVGIGETLEKALEKSDWNQRRRLFEQDNARQDNSCDKTKKKPKWIQKGLGISTIYYGVGLGSAGHKLSRAGAYVQLEFDSSASFAVGTTEMGQGMTTVLSQIVAQQLGIDYVNVRMDPADTSRVPDSGPTVASRATTVSGNALIDACRPIRHSLFLEGAIMLGGVAIEELEIRGQEMVFKDSRQPGIKISQVIKGCAEKKRQLSGHGWFKVPSMDWNAETGRGKAYMTYAWATNIAEVEVNTQSGEVKVIKVIAAHDVGKAINPDQVEAQIQGGTVQGAGYGTMEEILHNPAGEMQNTNFSTYIIPSSLDAPQVEPLIVESAFEQGPYGAKGFGEQPLMGVAPAITNAIYHATGVRLTTIPATPERMLAALANLNEE